MDKLKGMGDNRAGSGDNARKSAVPKPKDQMAHQAGSWTGNKDHFPQVGDNQKGA